MLKMPKELTRLCLCHLLTWFSVIAEAVFYTDFMGQFIFKGDPKVNTLRLGGDGWCLPQSQLAPWQS
jgi:hypothetical protein